MPKQLIGNQKIPCIGYDEVYEINSIITKRGLSDQQIASYVFETYIGFAKCHDQLGRTPLHMAASCGRSKLCQWLISINGADVNSRDWESGCSALQRALFHGHILTAVRLMQMGTDLMLKDKESLTAIDIVVKDNLNHVKICPKQPCQVYIWGSNDNYTLGIGTNKSRKIPELMDNFKRRNVFIKQVCMDEFHSIFVSDCCKVWVCGNGQGGRLGIDEHHVLTPKFLGIGNKQCIMAASALNHSLLLLDDGTVLGCGQNLHYELGTQKNAKECLSLSVVPIRQQTELITGVSAGKYHSVFYGKASIYTCGLNGGQLGHPFCENSAFVKVPTKVPINLTSKSITSVASSSVCIVFSLDSGDIYSLQQYQFKKIAAKQYAVVQVATIGGSLKTKLVNESNGPLKVVLLRSDGKVTIWQESNPYFVRCRFGLSRTISIRYIFLNESQILFTTKDGEAFKGTIGQIEKQTVSPSQENKIGFLENSECYHISVSRIPHLYRTVSITSDPKGKNMAVLQVHPQNDLDNVPTKISQDITRRFMELLEETSEMDSLHDIVFKVQNKIFPCHEYIIACNASSFLTLPRENNVITISDIQPAVFKEILTFMYTGSCSLLCEGSVHLYLSNPKDDPIKLLLEACNKYKISSLYKKIVCYKYMDGCIYLKDSSIRPSQELCAFKRELFPELYDVQVLSEDGKLFKAHKCILAARLDYFHSMLLGGWQETVTSPVLHLGCPSKTLEVLLDFLYTNEISDSIQSDGFDSLKRLLIVSDHLLIDDLKSFCVAPFINILNIKNAVTMLQLSFVFNATEMKNIIMKFISLNLEIILESRCLEDLSEDILLELDKFHRNFNADIFDKRIITPFFDFEISEEVILSCPPILWPENFMDTFNKDKTPKDNKLQQKSPQSVTKKKTAPKKPCNSIPEEKGIRNSQSEEHNEIQIEKKAEIHSEKYDNTFHIASSPPEPENILDLFDSFALNSSNNKKRRTKFPRIHFPVISQRQMKRSNSECEDNDKLLEPSVHKPQFKGWATISPPANNEDNYGGNEPSQASSFAKIVASEQEERNNLSKMKSKSFAFTQLEDKAMEDLFDFYNAANIFDERITVHRILPPLVAKPTWVRNNKTLFH